MAKKKINKKKALSAYFVASLGLAGVSYGVRRHSLTTLGHSAEALGLFSLLGAAIYLILHLKQKGVATGLHKVASSMGHFVLAWLGAGLAIFSLGAFIHMDLVSAIVTSAICGPLAVLLVSDKLIVIVFWLAWNWAVGEFLYKTEFAHDSDDKGLSGAANKFRKLVDPSSEKAPTEKPEGAHFLHTRETIEDFIIDEKDLPGRISLGIAHLATGWGKKKEKVHFGAPDDTHVIIYGMTRSGKTQLLIRYILNLDGSVSTHLVVTSTKGPKQERSEARVRNERSATDFRWTSSDPPGGRVVWRSRTIHWLHRARRHSDIRRNHTVRWASKLVWVSR